MKKNNVLEFADRDTIFDPLTALLRSGAQQLINQAVEAELEELLNQHSGRRTGDGNAVVVRRSGDHGDGDQGTPYLIIGILSVPAVILGENE